MWGLTAEAQSAPQNELFTFQLMPGVQMQVKDTKLKELGYIAYDSTLKKVTSRGTVAKVWLHAMYYLWQEFELKAAYKAVADQVNDDGTVKHWPTMSDALDRLKALKQKYGVQ